MQISTLFNSLYSILFLFLLSACTVNSSQEKEVITSENQTVVQDLALQENTSTSLDSAPYIAAQNLADSAKSASFLLDIPFETQANKNTGVITIEKLHLYNRKGVVIDSVENLFGQIIQIDSISSLKYDLKHSSDECNLHNFVKISNANINAWVYGKNVFEIEKGNRTVLFSSDSIDFKFQPTKNFGIGVMNEDGLTFCGDGTHSPVLLFNSKYNKQELVFLNKKNEAYGFDYLTYNNHDGWNDKILDLKYADDILYLTVVRSYQEGRVKINLEIKIDAQKSTVVIKKKVPFDNN